MRMMRNSLQWDGIIKNDVKVWKNEMNIHVYIKKSYEQYTKMRWNIQNWDESIYKWEFNKWDAEYSTMIW